MECAAYLTCVICVTHSCWYFWAEGGFGVCVPAETYPSNGTFDIIVEDGDQVRCGSIPVTPVTPEVHAPAYGIWTFIIIGILFLVGVVAAAVAYGVKKGIRVRFPNYDSFRSFREYVPLIESRV